MEKELSKKISKNNNCINKRFVKDGPSPPSEIVSDRPLERLIFGVAVEKGQKGGRGLTSVKIEDNTFRTGFVNGIPGKAVRVLSQHSFNIC